MATSKPVFKTTSKKPNLPNYTVEFQDGEFIFNEGDLGMEMYIIHEGKIEILKQMQAERSQLAVLEKGDFFGEMSILEDLPRTAAARAIGDVKLLLINGATFDQMLRSNPEIAVRMMRKLSRRLRETDRMLREVPGVAHAPIDETPPPPPGTGELAIGKGPQCLVHDKSGMEFALAKGSETMIGRRDPVTGIDPDIDLTPADTQRSISRRHAKIYRRGGKFFVAEEIGTMNGTFVNGTRLETGVPTEIKYGDDVRCGLVNLKFRAE
ncbi:MAG: cyclic nucleotide-binding domain-containing protein [Thermoanaerobaculia bacterium]|nr:cyclic nucleotide-binding domain-containing protein [Thermoanaerobaculia bacterium]